MELIIVGAFIGKVSAVIVVAAALMGFVIGWRSSNFFIAPRDFWTKSGATMLGVKLGIALGGGYFSVVATAYILEKILS